MSLSYLVTTSPGRGREGERHYVCDFHQPWNRCHTSH